MINDDLNGSNVLCAVTNTKTEDERHVNMYTNYRHVTKHQHLLCRQFQTRTKTSVSGWCFNESLTQSNQIQCVEGLLCFCRKSKRFAELPPDQSDVVSRRDAEQGECVCVCVCVNQPDGRFLPRRRRSDPVTVFVLWPRHLWSVQLNLPTLKPSPREFLPVNADPAARYRVESRSIDESASKHNIPVISL